MDVAGGRGPLSAGQKGRENRGPAQVEGMQGEAGVWEPKKAKSGEAEDRRKCPVYSVWMQKLERKNWQGNKRHAGFSTV